jgi:hypothetical protein
MEGEDAKNYLFFVGRNRFKEYFLKPFKSLYNKNVSDDEKNDLFSFNIMEDGAIFTLSMNRNYNVKEASILPNNTDNNVINLKLSLLNAYLNPIEINTIYTNFAEKFILRRENDRISNKFRGDNINSLILPDKINIVCYFVIMPALKDFINSEHLGEICEKYKIKATDFPIQTQTLNGIFVPDIKEYQTIAGCYLTGTNITVNNIYVLPCLHEIYEGARDGIRIISVPANDEQKMLYNKRNTNCRKDEEDKKDSTLSLFSKSRKDMNICDKINNTEVNWEVYLDFYNGYRDQNKSGRKLCRENNFLRIFLKYLDNNNSNFVVPVVPVVNRIYEGGKKYRKSRKHKSRKYKNKSRKYKNKSRK